MSAPSANSDGWIRRHSHWFPAFILGVGIIALVWSIHITSASVNVSEEILKTATRSAYLIVEVESDTSTFNDGAGEYRVDGRPGGAPHSARINIWNTGAQAAENVTVSAKFAPDNSGIEIWDSHTITKCRDIVCSPTMKDANIITIRAIEAGGFYSVTAEYDITLENLDKSQEPVTLTVRVTNDSSDQEIVRRYNVIFG